MRFLIIVLTVLGSVFIATPANAAGCVSRSEYRYVVHHPGMSREAVAKRFGTDGFARDLRWAAMKFDTSFEDEHGVWHSSDESFVVKDMVRSYRKCNGDGRVGVWFDNFTNTYPSTGPFASVSASWRNPRQLVWWY